MKSKLLLILTTTLVAFAIQNIFAQQMMNHKRDGDHFQMFQKLNLTDEQQDQISTLRLNHQMEMVDLKANLQKKELELAELKNSDSYTRDAYLAKVNAINTAKNQIAISNANFQMDVYQLLDETQKKEWNKCSQCFGERKEKRFMREMRENQFD